MALARSAEFSDELFERIWSAIQEGDELLTLTNKRPNKIVAIDRSGIAVETLRSEARGSGPQFVPAWMVMTAWKHLREHKVLPHRVLENELNVKRSAFVMALLARFPDVHLHSTRPAVLKLDENA